MSIDRSVFFFSLLSSSFFFSIEFERTIGREGERDRTFNLARENNGGERRDVSPVDGFAIHYRVRN